MAHAQPYVPSLLWSQAPEQAWLFLFFLVSGSAVNSQIFFLSLVILNCTSCCSTWQNAETCSVLCACRCMYKADLIGRAFSFCLYMRIFVGSFYEHPEGFSENQNPWWMQLNGKSCQISYLRDIVCVLWFRYDKSAFWQPTQSGYPSQEGQFLIRCIQTELTLAGFRVFRDESYAVDFSK